MVDNFLLWEIVTCLNLVCYSSKMCFMVTVVKQLLMLTRIVLWFSLYFGSQ